MLGWAYWCLEERCALGRKYAQRTRTSPTCTVSTQKVDLNPLGKMTGNGHFFWSADNQLLGTTSIELSIGKNTTAYFFKSIIFDSGFSNSRSLFSYVTAYLKPNENWARLWMTVIQCETRYKQHGVRKERNETSVQRETGIKSARTQRYSHFLNSMLFSGTELTLARELTSRTY